MRSFARPWEISYTSTSLAGVQAAVLAGMGVTALAESTRLPEFSVLGSDQGLPELPYTEIVLLVREGCNDAVRYMGEFLTESVQRIPALTRS